MHKYKMDNQELYNNLYNLYKDVTEFSKLNELMLLLRQMDPFGLQIVSIIIQQHSIKLMEDKSNPFLGKIDNQKATFDIRNFDPVLQNMLFDLCNRHLSKVNDGSVKVELVDN